MPGKYTPAQFVAKIKAARPELSSTPDADLLSGWLGQFPGDAEHLDDPAGLYSKGAGLPADAAVVDGQIKQFPPIGADNKPVPLPDFSPEPIQPPGSYQGVREQLTPTALTFPIRVAGPIVGSVAGGVLGGFGGAAAGAPVGGVGAVPGGIAGAATGVKVGGALGGLASEGLAQGIEGFFGVREAPGVADLALATALGGYVPGALPVMAKGGVAPFINAAAQRAKEGVKIGAGSSFLRDVAGEPLDAYLQGRESQWLTDPSGMAKQTGKDVVMGGGLGALLGGVAGPIERRMAPRLPAPPPPPEPIPIPPPSQGLARPTSSVPQYTSDSLVPMDFNPEAPLSGPATFGMNEATPLFSNRPTAFQIPATPSDDFANAIGEQVKLGLSGMLPDADKQALVYQLKRFGTPEAEAVAKRFEYELGASTPLYMQGTPMEPFAPSTPRPATPKALPPGPRFIQGNGEPPVDTRTISTLDTITRLWGGKDPEVTADVEEFVRRLGRSAAFPPTEGGTPLLSDPFGVGATFEFFKKHPELARRSAAAGVGGVGGAELGETPEEKRKYAAMGALAGAAMMGASSRVIPKGQAVTGKAAELLEDQARFGAKGFNLPRTPTEAKDRFVSSFQDYLHPLKAVDEKLAALTGKDVKGAESAYQTARVMTGGQAGGRALVGFNQFSDTLKKARKAKLEGDVLAYLNNRGQLHGIRNLEKKLADLSGAEASALQQRITSGEVVSKGYTAPELDAELAQMLTTLGPQKSAKVKALAQEVFDLNRKALTDAYNEGLVSKNVYDELVSRGDEYVPLYRLMDNKATPFGGGKGGLTQGSQKVVQTLKGSERTTMDPIQSSMSFYEETQREIARNKVAKRILTNLQAIGEATPTRTPSMGPRPGQPTTSAHETVAFMEGGKAQHFKVAPEVAALMKGLDEWTAEHAFVKLLGKGTRVLQAGAVGANLSFSVPNVKRDFDTLRRFLPGTKTYNPADYAKTVGQWVKGAKAAFLKDDLWKQAAEEGALMGTMQRVLVPKDFLLKSAPKWRRGLGLVVESIGDFNNILEEATKLTAFQRMKGVSGMDAIARAFAVREFGGSPDFAVHGSSPIVKQGRLVMMFLNPAIQGIAQTVKGVANNPKKQFTLLAGAFAGAVGIKKWNDQFTNRDGTPAINNVPPYDRDKNFIFISPLVNEETGEHYYYKVPKSHPAQLFWNPIQSALEDEGKGQIALDVGSKLLPTQVEVKKGRVLKDLGRGVFASANPVLRTPFEVGLNYNPYQDRPVERRAFQEASPKERYDDSTSPFAMKLARSRLFQTFSEAVPPVGSPTMVEHVLKTAAGGAGEQALGVVDAFLTGEKARLGKAVDPFKRRFVSSGRDVQLETQKDAVYEAYRKAQEAQGNIGVAKKFRPETLEAKIEENLPALGPRKALQNAVEALNKIAGYRATLLRDKTLSEADRKVALKELREMEKGIVTAVEEGLQ